jgi:D-aminoacyl-tRNA deacylase
MRVLLQRVRRASVSVNDQIISKIGRGYLLLVGITDSDTKSEADWLAKKIAGLRIFEDEFDKMNLSIKDVSDSEILVVSQFTLYGETKKGRRPSFTKAASPDIAKPLCEYFSEQLRSENISVKEGIFGAMMEVELINDGPVTLLLERDSSS